MYDPLIIRDTCQMQSRGHVSHFALLLTTGPKDLCLQEDQECMISLSLHGSQKQEDDSSFIYVLGHLNGSNHPHCASFEWDLISSSVGVIQVQNRNHRVDHYKFHTWCYRYPSWDVRFIIDHKWYRPSWRGRPRARGTVAPRSPGLGSSGASGDRSEESGHQ